MPNARRQLAPGSDPAPACRLELNPARPLPWRPLFWWGRAGDPSDLPDAHAAIGAPEAFPVAVVGKHRRRSLEVATLADADELARELGADPRTVAP